MTTGFSQAAGVDAGTLDDVFIEALGARRVPLHGPRAAEAAQACADRPAPRAAIAAAQVHDIPEPAVYARHLSRSLATAAPLLAADLAALAAGGLFATLALKLFHPGDAPPAAAAPLALLPVLIGYALTGLYSEVWLHPAVELRQSTRVTSLALLAAAAAGWLVPGMSAWCAAAWAVCVVLQPLLRAAARCWCSGQSWWGFPTLVIGPAHAAESMARVLSRSSTSALRPALLTDPSGGSRISLVPVVNDPELLRSLLRAKGIRHAVLCLSDVAGADVSRTVDRYGALVSHLLVVCEPPPLAALWGAERVCGLGGVEARNGLLLASHQAAKRATDVVVAAAAAVVALPALLAIAALVKLSSPGPVLYGHTRIGRNGRRFTAWKFRTMYQGSDALLRRHLERDPSARKEWERDRKLRDDPRVTPVGRLLRQWSLDELPQTWNVLRGDMSVVGPRPIVDDEVERYGDAYPLYAAVKPGISGLWQVSGRTDVGYEMRVKLDEFYARNWSPWLDAYVLVRTVAALLCRRGAY